MVLYLALQFGFMAAMPHDKILSSGGWQGLHLNSPLLDLALLLGFHFISVLLLVDSAVGPSGTGYTYLGASSRMLYAMAAEGQMPDLALSPNQSACQDTCDCTHCLGAGLAHSCELNRPMLKKITSENRRTRNRGRTRLLPPGYL